MTIRCCWSGWTVGLFVGAVADCICEYKLYGAFRVLLVMYILEKGRISNFTLQMCLVSTSGLVYDIVAK